MKITFTQTEINEFVAKHMGISVEISVEIDNQEKNSDEDWIVNTRKVSGHPESLKDWDIIQTLWDDGETLIASAAHWDNGWNTTSGNVYIVKYRIVKES